MTHLREKEILGTRKYRFGRRDRIDMIEHLQSRTGVEWFVGKEVQMVITSTRTKAQTVQKRMDNVLIFSFTVKGKLIFEAKIGTKKIFFVWN